MILELLISIFHALPGSTITKCVIIVVVFSVIVTKFVALPLVKKSKHDKELHDKLGDL